MTSYCQLAAGSWAARSRSVDGSVRSWHINVVHMAYPANNSTSLGSKDWTQHISSQRKLRVLSLLRNRLLTRGLCQILVDLSPIVGVSWEFYFVCTFLPWDLGCAHFVDFTYGLYEITAARPAPPPRSMTSAWGILVYFNSNICQLSDENKCPPAVWWLSMRE